MLAQHHSWEVAVLRCFQVHVLPGVIEMEEAGAGLRVVAE